MKEQARVMSYIGTGDRYIIVEREGRTLPLMDGTTGRVASFRNSDPALSAALRALDNWEKLKEVRT